MRAGRVRSLNTTFLGGGSGVGIEMKGALKDGLGRRRACQGSARPGGLSHPHLPLKTIFQATACTCIFLSSWFRVKQLETHKTDGNPDLKCTCIPMTRWTELSQRPAVSVEAPEELSRPVEGTSPGADLARTCRRVHSSPSPEGLNRPEYDLNPILPGVRGPNC